MKRDGGGEVRITTEVRKSLAATMRAVSAHAKVCSEGCNVRGSTVRQLVFDARCVDGIALANAMTAMLSRASTD